jgi:hypothetical protein
MNNTSNNTITASSSAAESKSELLDHPKADAAKPATVRKRKKNALTHGIYAEDLVLEWESADELVRLRDAIWAELQPEGFMEEETVVGIIRLNWLKRRLMRTSQLAFRRDPFGIEAARSNPTSLDDIVKLITSASDERASLVKSTKEALEELTAAIKKVGDINTACFPGYSQEGPPKQAFAAAQEAQREIKIVNKILTEQVFRRMCKLEEASKSGDVTIYEKAYSHDHLEKTLRLEAALDARTDKLMARLVHLKEYKRIQAELTKPPINSVSLVPDKNEPNE